MGSWTKDEMKLLIIEILAELFQFANDNKLKVEIEKVSLAINEELWDMEVSKGKRLVVTISTEN